MGPRDKILKYAKDKETFKSRELIPILKISRQTLASHLTRLVNEGHLIREGSTRNATYQITKEGEAPSNLIQLRLVKKLKGLEEDRVFETIRNRLGLKSRLPKNVLSIAHYSFSEMMNNAIDHSKSESAQVDVSIENGYFQFKVRDFGVGIFENVREGFKLNDEFEGAEHVLKGKQTTAPARHSGHGIFFTSRIADQFVLQSHRLRVVVDNEKDDALFEDVSRVQGTLVEFRIKQRSRKNLQLLFNKFSPEQEGYEFSKNEMRVRLSAKHEFVSRSQARRLLSGLDEFKEITFDFKDIKGIGQAFADEIFRVHPSLYPDKKIYFKNAGPAVEFMIRRAQEGNK
ncbi:MAG: DUF4325 domain-containing protein [Bdellovibrionia bacterium]